MAKRWGTPLTRQILVKDGPTLRTLDDVRAFMLKGDTGQVGQVQGKS